MVKQILLFLYYVYGKNTDGGLTSFGQFTRYASYDSEHIKCLRSITICFAFENNINCIEAEMSFSKVYGSRSRTMTLFCENPLCSGHKVQFIVTQHSS